MGRAQRRKCSRHLSSSTIDCSRFVWLWGGRGEGASRELTRRTPASATSTLHQRSHTVFDHCHLYITMCVGPTCLMLQYHS